MTFPPIDTASMLEFLTGLLKTPSPTGFTQQAIEVTRQALAAYRDISTSVTRKGALLAKWPGKAADKPRALTAHVDTLGAVVKEIKENGRPRLSRIGGFAWNTVEGEGCTAFLQDGQSLRGTLLIDHASVHVFGSEVSETKRDEEHMELRLDAPTRSKADTSALGVQVGDFVAFDPRVEINRGFVRSRYLDDKACVAAIVAAVQGLHEAGLRPAQDTYLLISNYEEVGHGASAGIPPEVVELLVVDMAAVGPGQASDEFHASLCVKDSGGPYHYDLSRRLRELAKKHGIDYLTDTYPNYGSDGGAFWRAGGDVAVALIGPGVDASHNYERTHLEALTATVNWVMAYLLSE